MNREKSRFTDEEEKLHLYCIYMDVLKELLDRGINAVFDFENYRFHTDKDVPDLDDIIKEKAINYYNAFIKNRN